MAIGGEAVGPGVAKRRMAEERRRLRGEHQPAVGDAVIERLFAEAVAHQVEVAAGAVAKRKGKHAVDAIDGMAHPVAADQLEQDLGVRPVAQGDAGGAQLVGERPIAVDLAVEGQRIAGGRVDARLGAAGEIDDRQPGVAERDAAIDKAAVAVRPAMRERAGSSPRASAPRRVRVR